MMKICKQCNKEFNTKLYKNKAIFCSHFCYGQSLKGKVPWNKNKPMSDKQKEKISSAMSGEKHHMFGTKHTKEHREKIRLANIGRKVSEESREKNRLIHIGKKHTEELKNKMKGRQLSIETRKKMSASRKGEKNPNWIKDRSKIIPRLFSNPWKRWRDGVLKRDGRICKIANKDCSGQMEAHHILNWKDFPELRYEINNGIMLCHYHHPRGRMKESQMSPYFQELVNNNKSK